MKEKTIIAGSGPAGLTAALYAARANLAPLVLDGPSPGGQLIVSAEVDNYPGFPAGATGQEIIDAFRKQAERFGSRFRQTTVQSVTKLADGMLEVHTDDGEVLVTETLIIATGAEARRLPIPAEKRFYGYGVSGCATCDGAFYRDKHVLVVGGGNTAMEDALFLTKFAAKVTIVHRRDYFRATPVEVDRARKHARIEWKIPYTVADITGDKFVEGAVLQHAETGDSEPIACDGIFVAIGHDPRTEPFRNLVERDEHGFIKADPASTRTSTPGVFACGDVRDPVYKQAVLAAGHGCMAALDVERYLGVKE